MKQRIEDKQTTAWLRANGLKDDFFALLPLKQIKALQAAHRLLAHHRNRLNSTQRQAIEDYRDRIHNRRQRTTITTQQAEEILNINAKIKRQIFKAQRQAKSI